MKIDAPRFPRKVAVPRKARLYTPDLWDALMHEAVKSSYRQSTDTANRLLRRSGDERFKARTLNWQCSKRGSALHREEQEKCRDVLAEHGFDFESDQLPKELPAALTQPQVRQDEGSLSDEDLRAALNRCNAAVTLSNYLVSDKWLADMERSPRDTVYISLDDVLTKRQREERRRAGREGRKSSRFISTTVVHVMTREGARRIVADTMRKGCKMALAYLLHNQLLENRELVFFADGAREIRREVKKVFGFRPYKYYLDYFHLVERLHGLLTQGMKGGKARLEENEEIRQRLWGRLWAGNISDAILYLSTLPEDLIKSRDQIDAAIEYLAKRKEQITCYALRKELGMLNSSNRAEQTGQMLISTRQKHDRMSWSEQGSRALATITAVYRNNETESLLYCKPLKFRPCLAGNEALYRSVA